MTEVSQNAPLNAWTEELGIVDKYFSLKKEWRINRMQFFVRNIIAFISFIIFFIFHSIISHYYSAMGGLIIIVIQLLITPYIVCINVYKRACDFNHNGLYYVIIYFVSLSISFLGPILLTAYIFMHSWWWALRKEDLGLNILWLVSLISIFTLIITLCTLQFRKWNPGNNQYGPAPTGKPLV